MTFGMMFGANQNAVDEWSTDDDGDEDYDDDDCDEDGDDCDDEEEYIPDEYFDEYPAMGSGGPLPMQMPLPPNMHPNSPSHQMGSIHAAMKGKLNQQPAQPNAAAAASWEPQVKQYSNMNLKDQLNKQRMQMQQDDPDDNSEAGGGELGEETEADRERKLKLAKKRAEKRRKQKEKDKKKSKESTSNSSAGNDGALNTKDFVDYELLDPEHLQKYVFPYWQTTTHRSLLCIILTCIG